MIFNIGHIKIKKQNFENPKKAALRGTQKRLRRKIET